MDIPKEAMAMVSFRHPADDSNAGTWNQKNVKNLSYTIKQKIASLFNNKSVVCNGLICSVDERKH